MIVRCVRLALSRLPEEKEVRVHLRNPMFMHLSVKWDLGFPVDHLFVNSIRCEIRWFAHGRCRDHSLLHGEEVMVTQLLCHLDHPEDRAKDDSSHRHGAEVLEEVSAEDGDNHSLLRGAEVSVEGRGKDDLSHLDFRVDRVKVVEVDGHRDQCRDARTRSHRCLGITDKRITRRGVLAAMGFLRGWGMS